ncbi:hypothetical protein [Streptomyces sp. NPDC051109]|uniref:hypothetical protein n=1 Tax=Streptomyces sp. NPDC051109 TaxID=3365642 RepID=UPI003790213A
MVVVAASVHENTVGIAPLDKVAASAPTATKAWVDAGFENAVVGAAPQARARLRDEARQLGGGDPLDVGGARHRLELKLMTHHGTPCQKHISLPRNADHHYGRHPAGALSATIGVVVGGIVTRRAQDRQWLRDQQLAAYQELFSHYAKSTMEIGRAHADRRAGITTGESGVRSWCA